MSETVALLEELIGFDTTSSRSNLALVERVADRLDGAGARIRLSHDDDRSKANILASFGPRGPGGVMLSGRLVEEGRPADLLAGASHEYTRHLLRSFPSLRGDVPLTGTRYIDRGEEALA